MKYQHQVYIRSQIYRNEKIKVQRAQYPADKSMAFHSKIDDRFKMTEVICVIERLKRLKDLITRKIAANLSPRHKMAHFLPF